jgi:hypothetical protein
MIQERADLLDKLAEFHNMAGATPAEIRNLALEVSHDMSHESIIPEVTVESSLWGHFVTIVTRTVLTHIQHVSVM